MCDVCGVSVPVARAHRRWPSTEPHLPQETLSFNAQSTQPTPLPPRSSTPEGGWPPHRGLAVALSLWLFPSSPFPSAGPMAHLVYGGPWPPFSHKNLQRGKRQERTLLGVILKGPLVLLSTRGPLLRFSPHPQPTTILQPPPPNSHNGLPLVPESSDTFFSPTPARRLGCQLAATIPAQAGTCFPGHDGVSQPEEAVRSGARSEAEAVTLRKSWRPHAVVPGSVVSRVMDVTVVAGPALPEPSMELLGGPDTGGLCSWDSVSRLLPCFRLNAFVAFLPHLLSRPRLPSHPTFIKAEIPARNTLFLKRVACVCFLDQTQTGSHQSSRRGCGIRGGAEHLSPSCSAPISLGLSPVSVAPGILSAPP